jgi:hypothetical protein
MDEMLAIVREDSPWAWGYWAYVGLAFQSWVHNGKPSIVIRDQVKYYRIDPQLRVVKQAEWNKPTWWPIGLLGLGVLVLVAIGWRSYGARQRETAKSPHPSLLPGGPGVAPGAAAGG